MPTFEFRKQRIVEVGHCDPAGMVAVPRLFGYFDANTWLLFEAALGVEMQDFITAVGVLPLVDVRIDCRKFVKAGDSIEITSRVKEFRRSSFDVAHNITVNGEVAVEGIETRVWASRNKDDPNKISARPIPQDVIARFSRVAET